MVVSGNHSSAYAGRYLRPITSRATVHSSNVGYEGSESEVVLFELATFLVITSATRKSMHDLHRFEKVRVKKNIFVGSYITKLNVDEIQSLEYTDSQISSCCAGNTFSQKHL